MVVIAVIFLSLNLSYSLRNESNDKPVVTYLSYWAIQYKLAYARMQLSCPKITLNTVNVMH